MNWINGFELLCYGITLLFLVDVIRRRKREELLLFLSAALAGFALELLADDVSNPVLLVCGGGPGIPQYLLEDSCPSALPTVFTVCYWDYRGTGASFRSDADAADMTTERYVRDALAVTDYLAQRFSNDKIYIMGHSFGTYLALKTVQVYPDLLGLGLPVPRRAADH